MLATSQKILSRNIRNVDFGLAQSMKIAHTPTFVSFFYSNKAVLFGNSMDYMYSQTYLNPVALRKAKISYNFGLSECNRVQGLHTQKIGCLREVTP